ncbi:MAG: Ig-like domain-containing protein [Microvirga sp.]
MYYFGGDASVFEIELQSPDGSALDAAPAVVFPDKDFLFLAEFKRRGDDLLLLGPDDRTAIILDYFKTGARAAILTVDGAGLSGATVEALAAANEPEAYAQAQAADLPAARRPIGMVEKVTGSASVMRNGVLVELQPGDLVSKGDVVQTASRSALVIKFNDGTVFGLSSDARIVLSEMIYAGDSSGNSALFTLVQGVIGFVAGRIAKTGDFKVDTPVATMAIRGTAVQTEISAASGTTKFSLLTEPDGKVGSFLLYYKNNPSRVIASVTDPSQSTIVSPVSPTQVRVTEVRKTSDAFQFESTFFRDLFQIFSSSGLKRGSSDTEGIPDQFATITLPAIDEHLAPFEPHLFRPDVLQRVERVVLDPKTPLTYEGIAIEDGPLVVVLDDRETGAATGTIRLTSSLPAGVTYSEATHAFTLNPSHPSYQGLASGETRTIEAKYDILAGRDTTEATISWVIVGRNDAPQAHADQRSNLAESGKKVLALTGNDRDVDGDDLRIVSWTQPLEGSVTMTSSGDLVFDPGPDFRALSNGQTATVSFQYTISDGHGGRDTATATLHIHGKGTFVAPSTTSTTSGILDVTHQPVTLGLAAPSRTVTSHADLSLTLDLGAVVQPQVNVLFALDISGSTLDRIAGSTVGDLNQDGRANTVLDAEIGMIARLTERIRTLGYADGDVSITIIPFNGSANPAEIAGPAQTALNTPSATFGLGDSGVTSFLQGLRSGGETSFEAALRGALDRLQGLDGAQERNTLYLLSDGIGTGTSNYQDEKATLESVYHTRIAAVGVGGGSDLSPLNGLDTTGAATRLTSSGNLDLSLLGHPLPGASVLDLDVFVNGILQPDIGPEDLVFGPGGLMLNASLTGLDRFAGDGNVVQASVTLSGGQVFTAQIGVAGALPHATDLFL